MKIIGLTGGIASGKSTVSDYIKSKGIPVVDTDLEARHALDVGTDAYYDVIKEFSEDILNEDKTVDRKKLGAIVFKDRQLVEKLNSIVHPHVIQKTNEMLDEYRKNGEQLAVIDVPLLIESGMNKIADEVWVVYVPEEMQIKRAMRRDNLPREQIVNKIKNQMPFEEKAKFADRIIRNDTTIENLYAQIDEYLNEISSK